MNYWENKIGCKKIEYKKDLEYFKNKLFTPLNFPSPIIDFNNLPTRIYGWKPVTKHKIKMKIQETPGRSHPGRIYKYD